jgi:hypothetical protein
MRKVPMAFSPAIVVGMRNDLVEVKMPYKDRWIYQAFPKPELVPIANNN